jgi:uncharacterized cupredoxin-like copper-binding protein
MSPRLAALGLIALLALAGCGATSSQSATEQNVVETPAPNDALVAPTPTITANQMTLTTDRVSYAPGDAVRVTIANGRSVSVYAIASNANCTALDVQLHTPSGWQAHNVPPCGAQEDPSSVEIKPRSATTVTITAPAAGMYRCALQYTTLTLHGGCSPMGSQATHAPTGYVDA